MNFIPEKDRNEEIKKSCQRCFQALRIDVNNEFEVLYTFLEKLPEAMAEGGRVAILTFHSGEDRLVKKNHLNASIVKGSIEKLLLMLFGHRQPNAIPMAALDVRNYVGL